MSNVSTYIKGRIIRLDTDLNVFVVLSKITRINNILANKRTQFMRNVFFSERPHSALRHLFIVFDVLAASILCFLLLKVLKVLKLAFWYSLLLTSKLIGIDWLCSKLDRYWLVVNWWKILNSTYNFLPSPSRVLSSELLLLPSRVLSS